MSTNDDFNKNNRRDYWSEVKAKPSSNKFGVLAKTLLVGTGFLVLLAILALGGIFIWYWCRIEPKSGQIAILIRKTGDNLAPDEIIATRPGQKGIQLATLPEGRYFYNPYTWEWQYANITKIPEGWFGVVTRLYGKDLPNGEIIAPEGYKGIVEEVLMPGMYHINPYAFMVGEFPATTIRPGHVGIQTRMSGRDPLHSDIPDDMKNVYIVSGDLKGVHDAPLGPGTYYINPFVHTVAELSLQSQRFELQGEDAISFLTQDGFTVMVEGTLEFAVTKEKASQLIHQVGDIDDILNKIILPKARGFSRIEGSKHPAISFIIGETRQGFQDSLEKHLVSQCERWGINIRSMLIRNITPPGEVTAIIREREVALQNQRKIEQQIEQARSQAELTRQEMLAVQNREQVESDTLAIRARIQAEQEKSVKITSSQREFEVAKLEAEAAKLQADSIIINAEAERDVIRMKNEAEAAVTTAMTEAFGSGLNLARYTLYRKTAPLINAIVTTDRAPGLGGIFQPLMPANMNVGTDSPSKNK